MNSLDKLQLRLKECEACIYFGRIIELADVPEEKRGGFMLYRDSEDIILHCSKCDIYLLIRRDDAD